LALDRSALPPRKEPVVLIDTDLCNSSFF